MIFLYLVPKYRLDLKVEELIILIAHTAMSNKLNMILEK